MRGSAVLGVTGVALMLAGCDRPEPTSPPPPAPPIVEVEHLYHYYASAPASTPDPQVPFLQSGQKPSLRSKYQGAVMAPELGHHVVEAQSRVQRALSPADAQAVSAWHVAIGNCSVSEPYLLTAVSAPNHQICVAPLFVSSIFLSSVNGRGLLQLGDWLKSYGIDPRYFSGVYDESLTHRGVTHADWDAKLGAGGDGGFYEFQASADYLIAYVDYCAVLTPGGADCAKKAADLVGTIDGSHPPVAGLMTWIDHANRTYDASSWGVSASGDGTMVLRDMVQATGVLPSN